MLAAPVYVWFAELKQDMIYNMICNTNDINFDYNGTCMTCLRSVAGRL